MIAQVSIIMGSTSDMPIMEATANFLNDMRIPFEIHALSAHRTPEAVEQFAKHAEANGIKVIIAAAGMAAHLPGVIASMTTLPIIGVPIKASLDGLDALLAIVQMPPGIPVATVGVGNAKNAGLLAARILGTHNAEVSTRISEMMEAARVASLEKGKKLNAQRNHKTGF